LIPPLVTSWGVASNTFRLAASSFVQRGRMQLATPERWAAMLVSEAVVAAAAVVALPVVVAWLAVPPIQAAPREVQVEQDLLVVHLLVETRARLTHAWRG